MHPLSVPKGFLAVTGLLVAAIEPVMPLPVPQDGDFLKYAITQGGLLAVVLVLLWSYRKDTMGVLQGERDRTQSERASVELLMKLAGDTREALTKNADAILSQAKTIDSLMRKLDLIDERRQRPPS